MRKDTPSIHDKKQHSTLVEMSLFVIKSVGLSWILLILSVSVMAIFRGWTWALVISQQWLVLNVSALPLGLKNVLIKFQRSLNRSLEIGQGQGEQLSDMIAQPALTQPLLSAPIPPVEEALSWIQAISVWQEMIMTCALLTALLMVRLGLLFVLLPLFALLAIVAITDGLVRRDLRRFHGARESALLFHRKKRYLKTLSFIGLVVCLTLPVGNSAWLMMGFYGALAVMIAITLGQFKKYT